MRVRKITLLVAGMTLAAVTIAAPGSRPALAADDAPAPVAPDPRPAPAEGAEAPAPAPAAPAETPATKDPRPLVALSVHNDFKREDQFFAQLFEGRLVADLADMETFRTGGHDAPDADYALKISIRDVAYNASTIYTTSKDADSTSSPQSSDQAILTVDLYYTLTDRQGKVIHEGKLSTSSSHEIEKSQEYTANRLKEEMIDRAAQRIERLIRKKIKSRRG